MLLHLALFESEIIINPEAAKPAENDQSDAEHEHDDR